MNAIKFGIGMAATFLVANLGYYLLKSGGALDFNPLLLLIGTLLAGLAGYGAGKLLEDD